MTTEHKMPLPSRIFANDEELGKRDDDHKPGRRSILYLLWSSWHNSTRLRKRRLMLLVLLSVFSYFLVRSCSSLNVRDDGYTVTKSFPVREEAEGSSSWWFAGSLLKADEGSELSRYGYDGPIRHTKLAMTLHAALRSRGGHSENRNVLFAAASLKCAATLIPLACEMARWRRSDVHFTFMGRDNLGAQKILDVNGVSAGCGVMWHGKMLMSIGIPRVEL